ncbi:MAG: hypothetical protein L0H96_02115 [Humibacillus sp.]|nr:hypothetical protein [Humibacillus sp.]
MTLRRPTTMAYAAVLASVVALSACTGSSNDPGPTGTPSPASTSASTPPTSSSAAPSTSSTATKSPSATTTAGPTFPKGVPTAAQKHTKEGAKAFAEHFVVSLNRSWTVPDANFIEPLCNSRFEACGAFINTSQNLEKNKQRYDGDPLSVTSFIVLPEKLGRIPVLMTGKQERRNVVTKNGSIVLTDPLEPSRIIFTVEWTERGWQIYSASLVKS